MKKLYTLLGIALMASGLTAQNSIEFNSGFETGSFNFISEATNSNVQHGANGEGVVWNFENLEEGGHAEDWFGETVEPMESMNPEYFSNADLCLRTEGGINKFWQHDNEGLTYLGYETESALLILDDPLVLMPYPFTLGQKHQDVSSGDLFGTCSDSKWECDLNAEVVGVGILKLPNATYDRAFKVKKETFITRTSLKTGSTRIYTTSEYVWYVNDVTGPVLEITNWTRDVCYGESEGKNVNFSTLSKNNALSSTNVFEVNVYPNPASGESQIRIQSDENAQIVLNVRDITGKEMLESKFISVQKGDTNEMIDLSGFEPGIYMIEILNGDVKTTKKLIVE